MKVNKIALLFGLILFNTTVAQTIEGKVVYQASLNNKAFIEQLKENSKISEKTKKIKLRDALNSIPINFFLFFKGDESLYIPEFDLNEQRDMGMKFVNETGVIAGDEYICYTNVKTKENFRQNFFIDKIIINVEPLIWELTQETKKIGEYTCYKATTILKEEREQGGYLSDRIIAWYAPQIPVTFGIQNFNGLPGLTLELSIDTEYGKLFYKATKIELNPAEKIMIKKPKGKAISHKEFIELINKSRS